MHNDKQTSPQTREIIDHITKIISGPNLSSAIRANNLHLKILTDCIQRVNRNKVGSRSKSQGQLTCTTEFCHTRRPAWK